MKRRTSLVRRLRASALAGAALLLAACTEKAPLTAEWVSTTEEAPWQAQAPVKATKGQVESDLKIIVDTTATEQSVEGFGSCFNELGWLSLMLLEDSDRQAVMSELFSPGKGADFNLCRLPIGANDFARNWYSFDETPGDFAMKDFSIARDKEMLIPFIHNAQKYRPDLKLWASPWSPPVWMKHNKHYASVPLHKGRFDNGMKKGQEGHEGSDMFIRQKPYLEAYALYFSKFIQAYRNEGIRISAVMPQNEFNSAQPFPSCCWTAAGLADFIGHYLGPAMKKEGVQLMFGTMERPNEALVDTILTDPEAGKYIHTVGFQWAGKEALPGIHKRYPSLHLWQTEQECGDGRNSWEEAVQAWNLMKEYFDSGVSAYMYWNTSLLEGGTSTWGWSQNSLVVVRQEGNSAHFTYSYTPEYYVMKHLSHYVRPGARKLRLGGDFEDALAFRNPDGSLVIAMRNSDALVLHLSLQIGKETFLLPLPAYSLSTVLVP
ncbi:MAG: beta-glycosidase [Tannerella sp.]|jgi:glucosylceramidase|nr:beta-glycosidase [Tannerella sp.]